MLNDINAGKIFWFVDGGQPGIFQYAQFVCYEHTCVDINRYNNQADSFFLKHNDKFHNMFAQNDVSIFKWITYNDCFGIQQVDPVINQVI